MNKQMTPGDVAALKQMYAELKRTLKSCSKNELIKMVGSTLIDMHLLKQQLDQLTQKEKNETSIIGSVNAATNDGQSTSNTSTEDNSQ